MHHVKIKTERPGKTSITQMFKNLFGFATPALMSLIYVLFIMLLVLGLCIKNNERLYFNISCFFLDAESTVARSKLDAVLKGLVEKSENETSEHIWYKYMRHCFLFEIFNAFSSAFHTQRAK